MSPRRPAGASARSGPRRAPANQSTSVAEDASWRARLDDDDEPLYTVAVVCELLSTDSQTLRRLGDAISHAVLPGVVGLRGPLSCLNCLI